MPRFCPLAALFIISLLLTFSSGCACNCGTCRESPSTGPSGGTKTTSEGAIPPSGAAGNVVKRNLSEVEMIIESVERRGDLDYRLKGRILSARSAGSAENMAETGQLISLVPAWQEGRADPGRDPDRRLIGLGSASKGDRVRCTITLGNDGTWQIVAVH
jgi:hypothetical protein